MAEQPIPISEIADPDVIRVKLLASGKDVHAPLSAVGAALNAIYNWATVTHAAPSKTTPVDADELSIVDSAAGNVIKKLTWANLKATLKTYFDTLYQALDADLTSWAGVTRASGFDTFTATPSSANLRTLLTDETGTGAAVFAGAPTITGVPIFSGIPSLTGGGLTFPATQVPSAGANDLDDYEEGTWTGTATADTGTFTTVSVTETVYTKIGRVVTIHGAVNVTTAGTAAGDIIVNGAPFTAAGTTIGSGREYAVYGFVCWASINPGTTVRIRRYDNITIIANGISVRFTITYRV